MAKYNLTNVERSILTSWLFEPNGYLDFAVNNVGMSARQALQANPSLDVTEWIRTNTPHTNTHVGAWNECAMVWWMLSHDNVNVTPPTRPPEASLWVATLNEWGTSITSGLQRADIQTRNAGNKITLYDELGGTSEMPAGNQLQQQQTMIDKVISVLS